MTIWVGELVRECQSPGGRSRMSAVDESTYTGGRRGTTVEESDAPMHTKMMNMSERVRRRR
jgi:hypothetical protein